MQKLRCLLIIMCAITLMVSCTKEGLNQVEINDEVPINNNSTNRVKSGIGLESVTPICNSRGAMLQVHLEYIGNWTFSVPVYIDVFEADGTTLKGTWTIYNNSAVTNLYRLIGGSQTVYGCSKLEENTDYIVRKRYQSVTSVDFPVTTSNDCNCEGIHIERE